MPLTAPQPEPQEIGPLQQLLEERQKVIKDRPRLRLPANRERVDNPERVRSYDHAGDRIGGLAKQVETIVKDQLGPAIFREDPSLLEKADFEIDYNSFDGTTVTVRCNAIAELKLRELFGWRSELASDPEGKIKNFRVPVTELDRILIQSGTRDQVTAIRVPEKDDEK